VRTRAHATLRSSEEQFLALPEEVRSTVMRHHQKYFTAEGTHFVAVMNTSANPEGLVRRGNERVLRARFNDARFFWDTYQNKKLADRVADLAHVTFQARLGSYLEKTERVEKLVAELGGNQAAQRAAHLAKADLTTELVKEFTELQGVVGGLTPAPRASPSPSGRPSTTITSPRAWRTPSRATPRANWSPSPTSSTPSAAASPSA
jgi:glycyl-tRNA synthetase beta chain